ncbi:MAG: ABC transporter permease [Acidimicrobiia bacterium]|nr:ABC transporter permease [Acidimicrobiia bacterium]
MTEQPFIRWSWIWSHLDEIWQRTVEHLTLTGIAVVVGFGLSLVLSIVALRFRRSYAPITWISGVFYTIPSIALFAFLVPFTGLSILTAEIGLVSYTLLILIRNIVAGIDGTPDSVREAALGMGYTDRRILWEIQVPLAVPVIVAGLRVASVTTVGLVTVTSLIGQGGYGAFIRRGLGRNFATEILVGTVMSILLATLFDYLLVRIENRATPWVRQKDTP